MSDDASHTVGVIVDGGGTLKSDVQRVAARRASSAVRAYACSAVLGWNRRECPVTLETILFTIIIITKEVC